MGHSAGPELFLELLGNVLQDIVPFSISRKNCFLTCTHSIQCKEKLILFITLPIIMLQCPHPEVLHYTSPCPHIPMCQAPMVGNGFNVKPTVQPSYVVLTTFIN